jgi:hypothetical protein
MQEDPALDQAREVLVLLDQGQYDQIAAKFNAQLSSELTAVRLAEMWNELEETVGEFIALTNRRSFLLVVAGERVPGVLLTCDFQNTPMHVVVEFDLENKVAALSFEPPIGDWMPAPSPILNPVPSPNLIPFERRITIPVPLPDR